MPDQPKDRRPGVPGSEPKATRSPAAQSSAAPALPSWCNTHLTAEEEAELGRESIRREGRISSEEMKAFIESLPGYVPKGEA